MSSVAPFWITDLNFTFGRIEIAPLSKVDADNNAAAIYLPLNYPA